ncbi:Hypothetical protein GbCGDNIH9_1589 [Granulibacter bethesdensis]|uniref:DUF6456 domain-containing protein n=1 Tax=Granulibacter bethesdensis TaxID=364410 RepID=A0AAC9K820_9PROT|nr:DUF6456 domain-containing protein [Granulibacter bethesdensis]APH54880.1 Hypothetical protein GbCGDNIH9_1589 [Granulibacter bethesdensis]APH62466.1 Hypothetical protein GbCGDNIH8_1589 [Granulibacter bethesdensis]
MMSYLSAPSELSPRILRETVMLSLPRENAPEEKGEASQAPAIRLRRRRDGLQLMHARGDLPQALFCAAERFRDEYARAQGISTGCRMTSLALGRVTSSAGPGHGPAERQLLALRRCRAALSAVPERSRAVFVWVVVDWKTLGAYEQAHHMRNGRARPWLIEALDALADHYAGRQPASPSKPEEAR